MNSESNEAKGPELKPVIRLLTWFTVCYCFSLVGYIGTSQGLWFWFVSLRRPAWSPPNWAITPVWTILYGLIAWASWQVWIESDAGERKFALNLFFIQLALNACWPWVYFAFHLIIPAIAVVAVLLGLAVFTTVCFWKINPKSGSFMIPYVVWLAFEAVLLVVVWALNR